MRLRRRLQAAMGIGAALFFAYLIGMNVFLRTRIFRRLISYNPEELLVGYRDAYSIFPGKIHVEGLTIRGSDGAVQWLLTIDRCDFWTTFFELARRKFHAIHVRGDGLTFRVRLRTDDAGKEHLGALPPVIGFSDPPRKLPGPPKPPPTDAEYRLWGIQLDDVVAEHVHELWIDSVRAVGDIRIDGRWLFHPIRWLDVGPAVIHVRRADVSYGSHRLASGVTGILDATVHPFDVRLPHGSSIFRQMSLEGSLRGRAYVADALGLFFPHHVAFREGEGPAAITLHLGQGVIRTGTHAEIEVAAAKMRVGDWAATGTVRGAFDVSGAEAIGRATVGATHVVVAGAYARADVDELKSMWTGRHLDLAGDFGGGMLRAEVRHARLRSLEPWTLPDVGLEIQSGRAVLDGLVETEVASKHVRGVVSMTMGDASFRKGGAVMSGNAQLHVDVDDASLQDGSVSLKPSDLQLDHARVRLADRDVELDDGVLHVTGRYRAAESAIALNASEAMFHGIRLTLSRGGARWAIATPSMELQTNGATLGRSAREGTVSIDIPSLASDDLGGLGRVVQWPEDIAIDHGAASARVHLDVDVGSGAAAGRVDLRVDALKARVASKMLAGNLAVRLRAREAGRATDLSESTLAFAEGEGPAERRGDGWWLGVDLAKAELSSLPGVGFLAKMHIAAKDVSPVWAFVASRTPVPSWVLGAVPFEAVEASCDVVERGGSLAFRGAAKGGGLTAQAEFARRDRAVEWAVHLDAGIVNVAAHSNNGSTQFTLFGGQTWYQERVASIRAREPTEW